MLRLTPDRLSPEEVCRQCGDPVAETNNPDVGPSDRADVSPAADGRALRWAGQRTRRRDEFVSAAVEAIRLHGPDVTVEAIAQSAGVTRTRIYRHFRDGAEIRVAVAARIADMLMTVLAPSSNTDGMPPHRVHRWSSALLATPTSAG
jgi:AcrR family transcriptional regulator